jgi:fatty-acid desaturase
MKPISFHTKLLSMLGIHTVLVVYAMFSAWGWWTLLWAYIAAKIFNAVGNEVALHRLWCHKAFKTARWKEFVLHFFATPLLYGSSITYAGIHRQHHA